MKTTAEKETKTFLSARKAPCKSHRQRFLACILCIKKLKKKYSKFKKTKYYSKVLSGSTKTNIFFAFCEHRGKLAEKSPNPI